MNGRLSASAPRHVPTEVACRYLLREPLQAATVSYCESPTAQPNVQTTAVATAGATCIALGVAASSRQSQHRWGTPFFRRGPWRVRRRRQQRHADASDKDQKTHKGKSKLALFRDMIGHKLANIEDAALHPEPEKRTITASDVRLRIAKLRASVAHQRREIELLNRQLEECLQTEEGCRIPPEELDEAPSFQQRLIHSGSLLMKRAFAYRDPVSFVYDQTETALRVARETAMSGQLVRDVLPNTPALWLYAPALYARATQLEAYRDLILPVLDGYLPFVEPHLETLIDRFDDIEPHLSFCLQHADVIAPHVGDLLLHLDDILSYAEEEDIWHDAEPFLPFLATRIKGLGPHLRPLRPYAHDLHPHLKKLIFHVDRLAPYTAISENAEALLSWFGWSLRVPGFHLCLRIPGIPRFINWMAPRLPRRMSRSRQRKGAALEPPDPPLAVPQPP
eukprot:TRINITY_DN47583_c0_g1_i1.p1 TRINITY_DN47583_c0_g1~~TRINITY_DN47583_c0_g1_i1.p1  ORF type:complete len:450 (+),score=58.41 TRINITY_DN47583_c0_g1_i1:84-1433(+)